MASHLRSFEGGVFPPLDESALSLQVKRTLAVGIVLPPEGALAGEREAHSGTSGDPFAAPDAPVRLRLIVFTGLVSSAFTRGTWSEAEEGRAYVVEGSAWDAVRGEGKDWRHFVLAFRGGQLECLASRVEFLDRTVRSDGILTALRQEIQARDEDSRQGLLAERGFSASSA